MFCAFENGDEIWEYLCCAYFPSTSKLEVRSNSGLDWFISNYKFDCLLNLGKVYSLLEKQDNLPHASEDELFDKRERGLAFDGSRSRIFDSSLLAEANKNTDDLSKFFSVLNIGLVQKDHEIRCATLSVLQKFFRKLPDIAKCDYDSLFFAVMEAYTNTQCDILIARCLDLSCNPQAFEIECVEVLRFYGTVINQIKLIGGRELVPHSVTVSIASILRETLYLVLASDEDFKKRGNLITLTLSLVPQRTATKSRRSFKYGDAPPADSKTFPGSLVAKVSASALAEALLVDFQSVSSSGAISVLINFIIHCSNIRLTESLLSTLLHVINFPDGRSSLSPRILHSFMSPLSLHPPVLAKGDVSSENLYLDDISSSFDQQLLTAKLSIICLLTSWPGVFSMGFSTSRRKAGFSSGISSLLNVLKVGHPKCRAVVLEILFHVFAIPFQKFVTDDGCDKDAIENDHLQYRLDEDFIIAEFDHWRDGSSVAELCWRSLRRRSVDMTAFHRVFLMATFIELGLIQSLKEAHLSSFSSKRVQESMRNLKDSSAQMELDFRYSVSYLLSYIFQTYLPVLPSSYKEYFTESIAPAAKNDCSPVDDVKSPDPVDFSNFDVTNTNEYYLSEDSLLPKASSSNVAIEDEAEVFSIRVIDSFLKLRLSQEGGGILGSSQGKRKQSSIFMEHLQGFYDHINSSDFMAGIPKTNSLKLDCHIIKLLYETNVFEHFETSSDAELIIIGENEASPFVPLPAAGESFLEASDKHKREERASFTVGSNLKLPWAQNKQKSVDHIEDPFLGYDINDVVTNSAGWNWVSICSCLRYFMYNCESGTSASGELQKKSLTFVKYLSMYFMPSNGLFSKESYKHLPPSQKNDMLKATYIAKIQAGSLLFRFLAAACAYSENCRSSNSDISANFMQDQNPYKEFSNLAERVFADLALSIEYELGMSLRKKSSSIHPLRSISTPLENSFQNGGPSCFSASSLPESMAQMYFIFLGGLPFSNRRLIFAKFQFLEMFINCLLSGSNEVLCKLILTCMHYDIESGASENCQLLEVALRASESRAVQMFALRFLSVLLSFWRETSPNVPWKEFGVKKVAWVVDMLFERVLSNDEHMRDLALTQLLELAQDPRCLPLMFSHERHLSLLNVGSDARRCSGEVPPPPNETPAAKFLQLKALCIFSRYFNCIIDLQPNITARQRTFSKTNQFTTSVEDGTVKTDGLSVLLQEYKELGRESWLHVVLVDLWCQQAFCLRYAQYVDHLCNAAFLARHATDPHGHFLRTSHQSNALKITKSVPIPPHLFGELVGTPGGAKVLFHLAGKTIVNHVDQLINLNPPKRQLPQVKAAIWTIAHIASTAYGFNLLPKGAVVLLVRLAERCQVYSVCGVVTMALNLLCFEAQSILTSLGWTPCSKFYSERDESVTSVDVDFSVAVDCGEQVDESESLRIETEINDICKDFVSHKNRELRRLKRKAVSATQGWLILIN